ncbi:Actin-1 [Dactylella cylindrospora]|nr:Actin-1 [Dactylella cylindrospora]
MSSREPSKLAPTTPYKLPSSFRTSTSGNPTTPQSRFSTSAFSSPGGSLHQVDEPLIFELGTRFFRAGFANESAPRCKIGITPEMYGRVGLKGRGGNRANRRTGEAAGPRIRNTGSEEWELWMNDLRLKDLGVVEDLMERILREAYNKYLLIESKSKRLMIILPPLFPIAIQNTLSQLLFIHFQPPTITYLPSPVLSCIAAGLRSAIVVDIGWQETTITPVYELRPLTSYIKISSRGSKALVECFGQLLWNTIKPEGDDESWWRIFNWAEVEDLLSRYGWCKNSTDAKEEARQRARKTFGLPKEPDEDDFDAEGEYIRKTSADIRAQRRRDAIETAVLDVAFKTPLLSSRTTELRLPFEAMSVATEYGFFLPSWTKVQSFKTPEYIPTPRPEELMEGDQGRVEYEDESDYSLPYLLFMALLHCPVDVRAVCIPRIVITGGAASMPGLKSRILSDVKDLVEERGGWNIVKPRNLKGDDRMRELIEKKPKKVEVELLQSEKDDLRIKYAKIGGVAPGTVRGVETMGAWAGGSIMSGARIKGAVEVEREKFLSTHRIA